MSTLEATAGSLASPTTELGRDAQSLRESTNWFVELDAGGYTRCYTKQDLATMLRDDIVRGRHERASAVKIHAKADNGEWSASDSTLFELASQHFSLRTLYEPVWSHAMAGLKIGALVGIALKLLDSSALLAMIDPRLAVLFLASIGICLVPRIGTFGVIAFSIAAAKFTKINLFVMGLTAAAVGATLGCLPGMAIGGIVGMIRKRSLALAKDAVPEPRSLIVQAVLLPLATGGALIAFYLIVVIPWLMSILE
jgi:hypothetical protein